MQLLGIEIRKKGNVKSLFNDVDRILNEYDIPHQSISRYMQSQACAHALQNMMQVENFFSVCTIDRCSQLCQIVIPIERKRLYDAAHCLHWNKMLPDFRMQLIAMILDDFRPILNPTP